MTAAVMTTTGTMADSREEAATALTSLLGTTELSASKKCCFQEECGPGAHNNRNEDKASHTVT